MILKSCNSIISDTEKDIAKKIEDNDDVTVKKIKMNQNEGISILDLYREKLTFLKPKKTRYILPEIKTKNRIINTRKELSDILEDYFKLEDNCKNRNEDPMHYILESFSKILSKLNSIDAIKLYTKINESLQSKNKILYLKKDLVDLEKNDFSKYKVSLEELSKLLDLYKIVLKYNGITNKHYGVLFNYTQKDFAEKKDLTNKKAENPLRFLGWIKDHFVKEKEQEEFFKGQIFNTLAKKVIYLLYKNSILDVESIINDILIFSEKEEKITNQDVLLVVYELEQKGIIQYNRILGTIQFKN
ncbi:hypothetical protein EHP00_1727 [Ecytonucleospora hepatopenaei]|uniref:Uncharacterized protein n=1 Tax=Ecytonucleospora hepatopenaei TaxID=646526 RepID=A0A1W0E691_9MICR|nr:hypothetical protein EHP00_1727 [Ecytonucleospora hepatopenaei]